jgi:hypothetical protein
MEMEILRFFFAWWPGADQPAKPASDAQRGLEPALAGSQSIEPSMEYSDRNRLVLSYSVRDTRIFSPRVLQPRVTQGNATERIAADSGHSKLPWVTVGDPGLGTKVGT